MAASGISEQVVVGHVGSPHATPTSFWALTLGSIGVVYGDIGTSPLYAMREALIHSQEGDITREEVLGVTSLLLWALLFIVTAKYVLFLMRADNDGEGGTLSLMALAQRALGRGRCSPAGEREHVADVRRARLAAHEIAPAHPDSLSRSSS